MSDVCLNIRFCLQVLFYVQGDAFPGIARDPATVSHLCPFELRVHDLVHSFLIRSSIHVQ